MNIAIPQWLGRVSPVFDSAVKVLVFEASERRHAHPEMLFLAGDDPLERIRLLRRFGVQVLICGAISRPLQIALAGAGVRVIPNTCGKVDEVLNAFLEGRLDDEAFLMPGTSRWKIDSPGESAQGPEDRRYDGKRRTSEFGR